MGDDELVSAFDKGAHRGTIGAPRQTNPYMPESEEEAWLAWNCGWEWAAQHQGKN